MIQYVKRPKKCPFCNGDVIYTSNAEIYGKEYGNGRCYLCKNCDAYTGVHGNTDIAVGIIANKEMRALKVKCHNIFDSMWKNSKERNELYYRLSKLMDIPRKECHFGHFDLDRLQQAYILLTDGSLHL